ncbi:MAG: hypothetical protein CL678_16975 [Bdellovibrionaceae bacterium]|nr:hypothetical protein [Pseudobdellovibrionaceae bacterium]
MSKLITTLAVTAGLLMASHTALAGDLTVSFLHLNNFYPEDRDKIYAAAEVFETVINSEEFKEAILNFTYNGKKEFVDNNGMTNQEVYDTIMRGAEGYLNEPNHQADLDLQLYWARWWKKWRVVGYTYPNTSRIYMNKYYFNVFTPSDVAGNMAHEWMHKIGFDHDFNRTARRPYSVPYAVGDLISEIAQKMGIGQ